jgi:autophagy-related protein 33
LLTLTQGVSYTLSTLTLPSLLFLPTASSAAQTHAFLKAKAKRTQRILSTLAISALTFAFVFSPPPGRHPYLLWTSLACGAGFIPGVNRFMRQVSGEKEDEVPVVGMEESGVIVGSSSDSGDEEAVNGELVRRGVERGRNVEAVRTGIWGLAFTLGVLGLWGDGA